MINYETRRIENPVQGYEMLTREVIKENFINKSYDKVASMCGLILDEAIEYAIQYSALTKAIERLSSQSLDTTAEVEERKALLDNLTIKAVEKDNYIKENGYGAYTDLMKSKESSSSR